MIVLTACVWFDKWPQTCNLLLSCPNMEIHMDILYICVYGIQSYMQARDLLVLPSTSWQPDKIGAMSIESRSSTNYMWKRWMLKLWLSLSIKLGYRAHELCIKCFRPWLKRDWPGLTLIPPLHWSMASHIFHVHLPPGSLVYCTRFQNTVPFRP